MGDHIAEAYFGQLSVRMKHKSHERLDWIRESIVGDNVLDIGCSQGILELLVASKVRILGMDVDEESIEYANGLVGKQPREIQNNIRMVCDDFLQHDFGEEKFSTIIFGEVLEHLAQPELFLEKARRLLQNNGRVIVTVPFGINRHPDHKQTFYQTGIYNLVTPYFCVKTVEYLAGCIAIQLETETNDAGFDLIDGFALQEKAFYEKEDEYLERIEKAKKIKANYEAIKLEKAEWIAQRQELSKKLVNMQKERDKKRAELEYIKSIPGVKCLVRLGKVFSGAKEQITIWKSGKRNTLSDKSIVENKNKLLEDRNAFYDAADPAVLSSIVNMAENVPVSQTGRYYIPSRAKIGIIADEFLMDAWKGAADFTYIDPNNWETVVDETEVLIVASSWRGINDVWRGIANSGTSEQKLALEIINEYKRKNKITVFYSKEDPPNYRVFLPYAQNCDYIFTTCEEIVDQYKMDCNNENVNVLQFCINPLFHNPVGMRSAHKKNEVLFSGSWMDKYPNRQTDLSILFNGVINSKLPLHIIDRNYHVQSKTLIFPRQYWKHILPSVSHDVLQNVHKLYNWAININSINSSKTMFANRSYELLASGCLMISNYSIGVNNKLPYVFTVGSESEIEHLLNGLSAERIYHRQVDGVRSVLSCQTNYDRVTELLNKIGIQSEVVCRSVLVVADNITDCLRDMFEKQTYENKKIISRSELSESDFNSCDIIAFFDSERFYGTFYLEDMINAFKYADVSYVTKKSYMDGNMLCEGVEHDFVDSYDAKYRTIFWREDYSYGGLILDEPDNHVRRGYSIDRFNYNERVINLDDDNATKLAVIIYGIGAEQNWIKKSVLSIMDSAYYKETEITIITDGKNISDLKKFYADESNIKVISDSGDLLMIKRMASEAVVAEGVVIINANDELFVDTVMEMLKHNQSVRGKVFDMIPTAKDGTLNMGATDSKQACSWVIARRDASFWDEHEVILDNGKLLIRSCKEKEENNTDRIFGKIYEA